MNYTRLIQIIFISSSLIFLIGCKDTTNHKKHFISNPDYRQKVSLQFEKVKSLASGRHQELFSIFDQELSLEEEEALMFLYAYMPLSDLSNNNGDFYLEQVQYAFATRDSFKWGKSIPEDVFRHFVLPYRINNEDSDSSRAVFFKELYPRIKDMNIEAAALEVNHWCHEKVNYKGTDSRTMSPLGVIKTAYGRCGEESTFTVTALRAVGIPARQVYTPRWAHTNDNHAWVEVFVDNEWKYMGACEPKPRLNVGWFDAPVLRAMMVHTKAFGQYLGSEQVLGTYEQYSVLNLLQNYVPVKTLYVKVIDQEQQTIQNVHVDFGLYNYAEFYPLKSEQTNADGIASITSGMGDIRIFASDTQGHFAIKMANLSLHDTIVLQLEHQIGDNFDIDIDYQPPVARTPDTSNTDNAENKRRFEAEDALREIYIATFYNEEKAERFAEELGLDSEVLMSIMPEARGNYPQIESYLEQTADWNHPKTLCLLKFIAKKDLHDVTADVLIDHLKHFELSDSTLDEFTINHYILNPRIQLERLTAYRAFLKEKMSHLKGNTSPETANNIIGWITDNFKIDNALNYYKIGLSPVGLFDLKVADEKSRNIFFVASLRSLGIPARIEQATNKPQYFDKEWVDAKFDTKEVSAVAPKAYISFSKPESVQIEPQYWIHFGLAKYDGQRFITLEYNWEKKWNTFEDRMTIEPGYYQMTTGNRLEDGSVLVRQSFFQIKENEYKDLAILIRSDSRPLESIAQYKKDETGPVVYAWILPDTEPGKHFLKDIQPLKDDFLKRGATIKTYTNTKENLKKLSVLKAFGFSVELDENWHGLNEFYKQTSINNNQELPVFAYVLKSGDLVYFTSGYNIGTPEQLLKLIDRTK